MTTSCIVQGTVFHRRTKCGSSASEHAFSYGVWMAYVDLDEAEEAEPNETNNDLTNAFVSLTTKSNNWALAKWRRADHFGDPHTSLKSCVVDLLRERYPTEPASQWSRVRVLTNLSTAGVFNFNPVSVFYVFDAAEKLSAVLLEVSNTPWLERRVYVLRPRVEAGYKTKWEKDFHVSPFMDRFHDYEWTLEPPFSRGGGDDSTDLKIFATSTRRPESPPENKVECWPHPHVTGAAPCSFAGNAATSTSTETTFVVGLRARRVELRDAWRAILTNPFMPASAVLWIHIEALRVWLQGNPYVTPPPGSRPMGLPDLAKHLALFFLAFVSKYVVGVPFEFLLRRLAPTSTKRC